MEKIIFSPAQHIYRRESDGMKLMSVSHFRKLFETTDWEHNRRKAAAKLYLKNTTYTRLKKAWEDSGKHILDPAFIDYLLPHMDKKLFIRMVEKVRKDWEENGRTSAEEGSRRHEVFEKEAITSGISVNPVTGEIYPTKPHGKMPDGSNSTVVESLSDLEPGFYPELIVWHMFPEPVYSESMKEKICGIAGQVDKPYVGKNHVYIGDYKFTSEPLGEFSYCYPNFGYEMHSGPFSNWRQTPVSGYRIQLNTYGWMFEQHGLVPLDLRLHNTVLKNEQEQEIVLDYTPHIIEEAIDAIFLDGL